MTRAAAYCRISSDPNERGVGVRRQEEDCRRLAGMREWEVVDVYIDNDRSAWNGKERPSFRRLIDDIEAGDVDAVIVYQSSRLTRQPTELEAFIDLHRRTGVRLVTTNGDVDLGSATGRFVARIHGAQAAAESDQISERVRRAFSDIAKRGQPHVGGRRAYGFMRDGKTHNPHEAAVIREAVDALLAGDGVRTVTRRLNDRGEPTVFGGRWRPAILRRMLLNPRMVGIRTHCRTGVHVGVWQPIITAEQQTQLKAILNDPRRRTGAGRPGTHLLSGVLRCGVCGTGMRWLPPSRRNKAAYICPPKGDGGCGGCCITASHAEAYIESVALQVADLDAVQDASAVDTAGIRARLVQLSEAFAREDISWDEYMSAKRVIDGRLTDASRLAVAKQSADRIRDRWPTMTTQDRREAILSLLGTITIDRGQAHRFDPDRIKVDVVVNPGTWSFSA